jgi:hypothetical protein
MAGQPPPLSDAQMDKVTAGFSHVFGNLFFLDYLPGNPPPNGPFYTVTICCFPTIIAPDAPVPVMSAPIAMAVTGT